MTVKTHSLIVPSHVDLGPARVVHCLRERHHVYIDRGSRWGNPFRIGREASRLHVIHLYEQYLRESPWLMEDLHELEGLVLGCFCFPEPCHGDPLLLLANPY